MQTQTTAQKKKLSAHTIGILLVIVDSFFFSLMSLFVRLAGDVPTLQKAFFRNAVAAIVAIIILARTPEKFRLQKKSNLPLLLARSLFGGIGILFNFWAIDRIGLADANILNKMSPFFAIVFSALLLKELPRRSDWLAVLVAFTGAAFVVKPGAGIAQLPALAGLLGGLCAGVAYTLVRKLGQNKERGPLIVAFFSSFTSLVLLPPLILHYHPMRPAQWIFLALAGICASLAQFAVTAAYRFAPAKDISVFDYAQVLFASIWGITLFGERPDVWSVVGYVIIIGTAVFRWNQGRSKST